MKKKCLITISSLLFTLTLFSQAKPNILFIVVDDLNDYVEGFDGQPQVLTPSFMDLESRGCTFTNAFANAPGCAPSRTSFLSGKDIDYTQVFNNSDYTGQFRLAFTPEKNNSEVYTLPEILKDSGDYFTYTINKIFHSDQEGDFDNMASHDECEKEQSWNKQTVIEEPNWFIEETFSYAPYVGAGWAKIPDSLESHMQDVIGTDSAIQFIEDYASGTEEACGKPFFMAMGYHRPHTGRMIPEKYFPPFYVDDIYTFPFEVPYNTPANAYPANGLVMPPQPAVKWGDYYALPEGGMARTVADFATIEDDLTTYVDGLSPLPTINDTLTDDERKEIIKEVQRANHATSYIAAVQFIDAQIGRLIAKLDSYPDIKNNTLIVLVSDHGYALGEKKHYTKWALWETDIRVPFIIIDPSKEGNTINTNTVDLLDIFPTILDMTGTTAPKFSDGSDYLDGVSILPLFDDPELHAEHPILTTYKKENESVACFPIYSVRSERFHYIRYRYNNNDPDVPFCDSASSRYDEELYELGINREIDPNEWNNIASDSDYQPLINYLNDFLPDSAFYMQNIDKAIISVTEPMPCFYDHTDNIPLQVQLYTPEGMPVTGSALDNYVFSWTNNLTADIFTGISYDFNLSSVPEAVFDTKSKIIFYLHVTDIATGKLAAFDINYFFINTDNTPVADYTATVTDGYEVSVSDYTLSGSYTNTKWDFGDGTVLNDYVPDAHLYTEPGLYLIQNIIYYGNDCSVSFDTLMNIMYVAVEAQNDPVITLYPNPATRALHISILNPSDSYSLLIYDILGNQLMVKEFSNSKSADMDISALPQGNYFLKVVGDKGYTVKKFEVIR